MQSRKKSTPLLVLSVASLVTYLGFSSWNLNSSATKDFEIKTNKTDTKVAYFGSRYFTSIEGALKAAEEDSNANTVYVIPGTNPTITRSCTIASNDTLCIPYEGETWQETAEGNDPSEKPKTWSMGNQSKNMFADSNKDSVIKYRKQLITIDNSNYSVTKQQVVLTNYGKIQIGGQFGIEAAIGQTGLTLGFYSEILLSNRIVPVKC